MEIRFPAYIDKPDADEARSARAKFLLRLAALYYSPEGKMNLLSERLGLNPNSLAGTTSISAELAVKLEGALGRDLFPRETFRPDLFVVTEEL